MGFEEPGPAQQGKKYTGGIFFRAGENPWINDGRLYACIIDPSCTEIEESILRYSLFCVLHLPEPSSEPMEQKNQAEKKRDRRYCA